MASERAAHKKVGEQDARFEKFVSRVERAGWLSTGGVTMGQAETHIGFYRQDGRLSASPEEAVTRLRLADDESSILPGFDVETDDETGELTLGYSGPSGPRSATFVGDVIAWGNELNGRQAEALARERYISRASYATDKLLEQLDGAEIVGLMAEAGVPRQRAIADVVKISAGTFTAELQDPRDEADMLETWGAYAADRHTKELTQLNREYPGQELSEVRENPQLQMLRGIQLGVQRQLDRVRGRAELLPEVIKDPEAYLSRLSPEDRANVERAVEIVNEQVESYKKLAYHDKRGVFGVYAIGGQVAKVGKRPDVDLLIIGTGHWPKNATGRVDNRYYMKTKGDHIVSALAGHFGNNGFNLKIPKEMPDGYNQGAVDGKVMIRLTPQEGNTASPIDIIYIKGNLSRPRIDAIEDFYGHDKSSTGRDLDKLALLEATVPSILDTAFGGLTRARR